MDKLAWLANMACHMAGTQLQTCLISIHNYGMRGIRSHRNVRKIRSISLRSCQYDKVSLADGTIQNLLLRSMARPGLSWTPPYALWSRRSILQQEEDV
jgi:hypothetical protein